MADREKQKKPAVPQGGRKATPSQVPKRKVIEPGQAEQGESIAAAGPRGERPAGSEAARAQQRQQYRHGGTPIGSDPRE
jgi:hypothetical protein